MRFKNYKEFWDYYLTQHQHPYNRLLHVAGLAGAVISLIVIGGYPGIVVAGLIGYALAWVGHALFEKNRPATWSYPVWSFISEFRMVFLFCVGGLTSRKVSKKEE